MQNKIEFFKFVDKNKKQVKIETRRGGSNPAFRNIKLNKIYYYDLIEKLDSLKPYFQKYSSFFESLPISMQFDKLLSKGDRFEYLFNSKKILKQIDSKYQFKKEDLLDEIEITYLLDENEINIAIDNLRLVINFLDEHQNEIKKCESILEKTNSLLEKDKAIKNTLFPENVKLSNKTKIMGIFKDTLYLKTLWLYKPDFTKISDESYVKFNTIKNHKELVEILAKKNIKLYDQQLVIFEGYIYNLDIDTVNNINQEFPFLINMASSDRYIIDNWKTQDSKREQLTNAEIRNFIESNKEKISNTCIGVVDSHGGFQKELNEIIEIHNDSNLSPNETDYAHGTAVSTLIALNDLMNGDGYQDGLGIFKVKHFGIIGKILFQSKFLNKLNKIISENQDIKIWNLSIEILQEFLSPRISELGRQLDLIQKKYKVLIVIASGNYGHISMGGDSILSLTVGSLFKNEDKKTEISRYTGSKKIFNLFDKPNVYDFGNDINSNSNIEDTLWIMDNKDGFLDKLSDGTSYAAALLTRKCAYLMDKFNFSVNEIKSYINACNIENRKVLEEIQPINVLMQSSLKKKIIIGKTFVRPGYKTQFELILPFQKRKNNKYYRTFLPLISVSYLSNTNFNVGDEYSSTEVELKLRTETSGENLLNKAGNTKDTDAPDDDFKTQHSLIKKMKKYNPNKVLEDELFTKKKNIINNPEEMIKPLKLTDGDNKVIVELTCSDLFNHNEELEVGYTIFLYEIGQDSLVDFAKENEKLVEKIKEREVSQEMVKVKA